MVKNALVVFRKQLLNIFRPRKIPDSPIFFMHIPKTGGTSARHILMQRYSDDQIFPNLELMDSFGGRYPRYPELKETHYQQMQSAKFIIGHYPITIKNKLPGNCRAITFLRDPVKRAISNLHHIYIHGKSHNGSLEEVFEYHTKAISNFQTRQISGDWELEMLGEQSLVKAIENLNLIDCLCLTESFEQSLKKIGELLKSDLGPNLVLNRGSSSKPSLSQDLVKKITVANQLDIALYNHARRIFENR